MAREQRAQGDDHVVGDRLVDLDEPLLDATCIGDDHEQQAGGRQRHNLDVPDHGPGEVGVLHDGDLSGQLGQQPDGSAQHVVEIDTGLKKRLDGPPLAHREGFHLGEPVDEEPIALVRRDPAG